MWGRRAIAGLVFMAAAVIGLAGLVAIQPRPIASPSAAPTTGGHFAASGIAFDYPPTWTVYQPNHPGHYESVLAYLGTGTAHQTCGPDYIPGAGACDESYDLPPGTIILRLSIWDGPPSGQSRVSSILSGDPAASPTSIDGQRAVVQVTTEPSLGATAVATILTIQSGPSSDLVSYQLEFLVNRPDAALLQPTIDRLLRTVLVPVPVPH